MLTGFSLRKSFYFGNCVLYLEQIGGIAPGNKLADHPTCSVKL